MQGNLYYRIWASENAKGNQAVYIISTNEKNDCYYRSCAQKLTINTTQKAFM